MSNILTNQASRFTKRSRRGQPDFEHHPRSLESVDSLPSSLFIDRTMRFTEEWAMQRMRELGYGLEFAQGNRPFVETVKRARLNVDWNAESGARITRDTVPVPAAAFAALSPSEAAKQRKIIKKSLLELDGAIVDIDRAIDSALNRAAKESTDTAFWYVNQRGPRVIPAETMMEVATEMRDKFGKSPEFAQAIAIPTIRLLNRLGPQMNGSAELAKWVVEDLLGLRQYYLQSHSPEFLEDFLITAWLAVWKCDLPDWRLNSPYWRQGLLKRLRNVLKGNFDADVGLKKNRWVDQLGNAGKVLQLDDENIRVRPEIQMLEHVGRRHDWEHQHVSLAEERDKMKRSIHEIDKGDVVLRKILYCLAGLDGHKSWMSHSETAREIDRDPVLRKEFVRRFGARPDPHNFKRFFDTHFGDEVRLALERFIVSGRTLYPRAQATHSIPELSHPTVYRAADGPRLRNARDPAAYADERPNAAESQRRGPFENDEKLSAYILKQSPERIVQLAKDRPEWFRTNLPQIDPTTGLVQN